MKINRLFLLGCYCILTACASGPKLSELETLPFYGNKILSCSLDNTIAVMPAFYLRPPVQQVPFNKNAIMLKTLGINYTKGKAVNILMDTLKKHNITISEANKNNYLTREQRLLVDKIIVLKSYSFKNVYARDGSYLDANIGVDVYERNNSKALKSFDVWGRLETVELGNGINEFPTAQFDERLQQAYENLLKYPEFMNLLCSK